MVTLFCTILLLGCGKGKVTYEEDFPTEDSPALMEFMKSYLLTGNNEMRNERTTIIYSEKNHNEKPKKINYFKINKEKFKDYYKPLFEADDVKSSISELKKNTIPNESLSNKEARNLPSVEMIENNRLKIGTMGKETVLDLDRLMADHNFDKAVNYIVNIIGQTESKFVLTLEDVNKIGDQRELYYLLLNYDLSELTLAQLKTEETKESVKTRQLEPFYDAFQSVDDMERYKVSFNRIDILDTKTNKLTQIKADDYISKDGKFVYIGGDKEKLVEGRQQIQAIKNYIEGNEIYEAEFKLNYKDIAKKLGLKTSGAGIVKLNYFNKDYIVLAVMFDGIIVGETGFTNIIIDLQEDRNNPKAYLVDLDIATPVKYK